jgi:hypothetical protein
MKGPGRIRPVPHKETGAILHRLLRAIRRGLRVATSAFAALAVLAGLMSAACRARPSPGDKCAAPDRFVCSSHDQALMCESATDRSETPASPPSTPAPVLDRHWSPVACRGARGCGHVGEDDECDDTLAAPGDPCPRSPPVDYACATDLSSALVCKDGHFGLWRRCRGPERCRVVDGRDIHCDTSLGEAGDPCERSGTFACSTDGKTMLQCDGKALVAASSCRGPKGCSFDHGEPGAEPHRVECDDSAADEGDPCTQPRRITCASDHKAELVCDGRVFTKKRECRRSDCRIEGTELTCD